MSHKILLVEDESAIRDNLRQMLEAEGYTVCEAGDGAEGIRLAAQSAPDLVLCDVNMPGVDGYQVLASLRAGESTMHVPFLFLTALADRSSLRRGMELGAEDYLTKPFSRQELLAAVTARLERSRSLADLYRRQLSGLRNTLARALPHELLTPLNGILGLSGILMEEYETVRRAEMLDIARGISNSGETLHRLARRFLTYAELEMALMDPSLRARLTDSVCKDPAQVCQRALGLALPALEGVPRILGEHLELLLSELSEIWGPFQNLSASTIDGTWRLLLHRGNLAPSGEQCLDGSNLSESLIQSLSKVYALRADRLETGLCAVAIPLA